MEEVTFERTGEEIDQRKGKGGTTKEDNQSPACLSRKIGRESRRL